MKLKIISDGTVAGTRVINRDTDEAIEDVYSIAWEIDAETNQARAFISFIDMGIELDVDYDPETDLDLDMLPKNTTAH